MNATTPQGYGRLKGKTALVTGSTRGLGRTIAEWLAREGANIVVSGRDEADVQSSVDAMKQLGVDAIGIPADLARLEDIHRLGRETIAQVDHLDILVNNAGMSIRGNFWEVTDEDWEYQINVNLRSAFVLAQYAAAHMIEKELRGRIVNISTIGVHTPHADGSVYNAAKGGIETVTQNMALELAPYGISVNCIAPGAIAERPGAHPNPENLARSGASIPYGRVGRSDDIAAAALFFCLPESEYTTGRTLLVDGALHLGKRHQLR